MRGSIGRRLIGVACGGLIAGCLDVPAHEPCAASNRDCDGDGWVRDPVNPDARDCDDRDPTINPGAVDDAATAADEDCLATAGTALAGVSSVDGELRTGLVSIGFERPTGMPSSLRFDGAELLARTTEACLGNQEEGFGVSLFPAAVVHLRSTAPIGISTSVTTGPAIATRQVEWTVTIPATGNPRCASGVTLDGSIRFTALPGGQVIRADEVTVTGIAGGTATGTCAGPIACFDQPLQPILSSYLSLIRTDGFVDLRLDREATAGPFPTTELVRPTSTTACLSGAAGFAPTVALGWLSTGAQGLRLKPPEASLVHDWFNATAVPFGSYHATTALAFAAGQGRCDDDQYAAVDEHLRPAPVDGFTFLAGLGAYQAMLTGQPAYEFHARANLRSGVVIRVSRGGGAGYTVWRRPLGGAPVRLARGVDFLAQDDADGLKSIYLPSLRVDDRITIAEPGQEPPP